MDITDMQRELPPTDVAEDADPQPLDVVGFTLPYDYEAGRYRFRRIVTSELMSQSFDFLLEELDGRVQLEVSETELESGFRKGLTVSARIEAPAVDEPVGTNIQNAVVDVFANIRHHGPLAKWAQAVIRANGYRIGRED